MKVFLKSNALTLIVFSSMFFVASDKVNADTNTDYSTKKIVSTNFTNNLKTVKYENETNEALEMVDSYNDIIDNKLTIMSQLWAKERQKENLVPAKNNFENYLNSGLMREKDEGALQMEIFFYKIMSGNSFQSDSVYGEMRKYRNMIEDREWIRAYDDLR